MKKIFESLMVMVVVLSVAIFINNSSLAEEIPKKVEYYSRGPLDLGDWQVLDEARLTFEIDGSSCFIVDGEDKKPLNDKPDYALVTKNGRKWLLGGEEIVEPRYGNFYRQTRDKLIGEYVEKFKAIVSGKVKGKIDIHQNPTSLGGDTRVDVVAQDGTEYFAKDKKGDGSTEYFQVRTKGSKNYVIFIRENTSPGVQKLIGNLIKFTLSSPKESTIT